MLSGSIAINGKPVLHYTETAATDAGFFYIDSTSSLAGTLSVCDNIFLLRKKSFSNFFYHKKASIYETAVLLEKVGLKCDPQKKVYELTDFQRLLVCIAKALSYQARLLILNLTSLALSTADFNHLAKTLAASKSDHMSCLIIDNNDNPLARIADTAIIISQGTDRKTIRHQPITQDLIHSYFMPAFPKYNFGYSVCCKTEPSKKLLLKSSTEVFATWIPGRVIGMIDYSPELADHFRDYIKYFCHENSGVFTYGASDEPLSPDDPSFRWIPENSNLHLLENLSIADNLLLPRYPDISGPCGYMKKDIKTYCEQELCTLMHLSELPLSLNSFSALQKRILSIYRFALPGVKALFAESPFINLDPAGQAMMGQLLKQLSSQGFAVFIISRELNMVQSFCTDVIICNHYRWEKTIAGPA